MTSLHGSDPAIILDSFGHQNISRQNNTGYFNPCTSTKDTILSFVQNNKEFSLFYYIIQLARLENILDDSSNNTTIFIPSDLYLKKKYPDSFFLQLTYLDAKSIVLSHQLPRKITLEMLLSSKNLKLDSIKQYGDNKSFYSNCIQSSDSISIQLDNSFIILDQSNQFLQNGIVHVIDDFINIPIIC